MSYTLFLLDFDGTLAATEPVGWGNISRVMAKMFGVAEDLMLRFVQTRHGQTIEQYYPALCKSLGREPEPDGAARIKAEHTETLLPQLRAGIPPAHNLVPALDALAEAMPSRFCVASNSVQPRLEASIDGMEAHSEGVGTGLRRHLSGIFSATDFKPDPEVFLTAIQAQDAPPARVVVVEDSAAGLKAAVALRDHLSIPVHIIATAALRHDAQKAVKGLTLAGADKVVTEDDFLRIAEATKRLIASKELA